MVIFDSLYVLINRLTKEEKRSYKLHASRNERKGKNNYLQLFEELEKLPSSNKELLNERVQRYRFASYYMQTRGLLFRNLIKVLRQLPQSKPSFTIRLLLDQAEILGNKNLTRECRKSLRKAKQLAIQEHLHCYLPVIQNLEEYYAPSLPSSFASPKQLLLHQRKTGEPSVEYEYLLLLHEARKARSLHRNRLLEEDELAALSSTPLVGDINYATTFLSRRYFLEIRTLLAESRDDFHCAYQNQRMLQLYWMRNRKEKTDFLEMFTRDLSEYLLLGLATSVRVHYRYLSREMNRIRNAGGTFSLVAESLAHISCHLQKKEYPLHATHRETLTALLEGNAEQVNPEMEFLALYHLAVYHFIQSCYQKTIIVLHRLRVFEKDNVYPHLHDSVCLLQVICQFESGNFEYLDYLRRNIQRSFKKRNRSRMHLTCFFSLLESSLEASFGKRYNALLKRARTEIGAVGYCNEPGTRAVLAWLEGRGRKEKISELFYTIGRGPSASRPL